MSKARKLFRLAKSLIQYNALSKFIAKSNGKINAKYIVEIMFRMAWIFYFYYDNLKVMRMINFIKYGTVAGYGKRAAFFEFVGHCTKIVRTYLQLKKVNFQLAQCLSEGEAGKGKKKGLQLKRTKLIQAIFASCCDAFVAHVGLGINKAFGYKVNNGVCGFTSGLSAAIGLSHMF